MNESFSPGLARGFKCAMSVYYLPTIVFTCIQGPLAAQSRDDPDP